MKRLDRNRKYGTVYGDPKAFFYQDGVFFDAQGRPVGEVEEEEPSAAREPASVVEKDDGKAKRMAKLNDVHIAKLKKLAQSLAEELGEDPPPMKGKGVKAGLVQWIADRTD